MSAEEVNSAFSQGNLAAEDLARRFKVSRRTICRRLKNKYREELPHRKARKVIVMMDATYWGRNSGVVIMKDSISGIVLWYKFITKRETLSDYREGIDWITSQGFEIVALVGDGFKGLRSRCPHYKFQLCQFPKQMTIRTKLTLHPKLPASQELLALSKTLCKTDKESFVGAFAEWESKWNDFLSERAVDSNGRTHYVHKNPRSAYFSLKRNMPWLWTWYDHIELGIPNTNNALESINSDLKTKLNIHKGISLERRKVFIQDFIKAHNPHKHSKS